MQRPTGGGVTTPLPPLRDVIARHGLWARKSLGQNFLLDGNVLAKIVRGAGVAPGSDVYEVGPGPGGLTRALLQAGARVVAVERDERCLAALAELHAGFEGQLTVIAGDALAQDEPTLFAPGSRPAVVANLPYNIGTALLVRWLTTESWPPWWGSLTLMFQKEVAQRIVAAPGSTAYGRLAVLAQVRCRPRILFDLSPQAFTPPPKVTSSVVHIVPDQMPDGLSMAALERVTAAAFGQRRKMLRTALKSLGLPVEQLLDAAGLDGSLRAETLGVSAFVALARAVQALR